VDGAAVCGTALMDVIGLPISRTAELLRDGVLCSVDLVRAAIAQIERVNPRLNAFLRVYPEQALAAARQCDAEGAAGHWRSPLHGVPFAAKDVIDVAGEPTTCHSRILMDNMASADAPVIARLRHAGAILLGKTALHEFATGGPSFDLPWPPARNPWNPALHPGGSSSGSAVAVAAGLVPFALGTDTAGSVRHPASVCGIAGMKPTFGAVPVAGCFPLSFSLDHIGPLTRGAQDNAIVLGALLDADAARRMHCDPTSLEPFTDLGRGLAGLRIGVIEAFHRGSGVNPEIASATDAAVDVLRMRGAQIRILKLSPLQVFTECGRTILQSESFAVHAGWLRERPGDYGTRGRRRLLVGALISAERYVRAQQIRTQLVREFFDAMRDLDVAVSASSLELPCAIDDETLLDETYDKQARTPFNVLGVPAMSVPIALSSNGLPIGLQLAAKPYAEGLVYRAAVGLEQAIGKEFRPPIGCEQTMERSLQ
jgi:aspartyl-tRNA(Asn)/glutamyl-tRNA(Gln) amidotransferase subunit A